MSNVVALDERRTETVAAAVDFEMLAAEAIEFLNKRSGKRFPARLGNGALSKSAQMVVRLLRDGYPIEDIKSVIAMKSRAWGRDPRMRDYLRPKTLFGPENFENYVGELQA